LLRRFRRTGSRSSQITDELQQVSLDLEAKKLQRY
jgi:hypothetical protein